jgi:hypothetical protein
MHQTSVTRRTLPRATASSAPAATTEPALRPPALAASSRPAASRAFTPGRGNRLFRDLDEKIRASMVEYGIPGVAVVVLYHEADDVNGYAMTNVEHPVPVDGDTVLRIESTIMRFTGTRYLPDLRTSDPLEAARVGVRQRLNHTAGISRLPALTPPGQIAYNNAAVVLAGRYLQQAVGAAGDLDPAEFELTGDDGQLVDMVGAGAGLRPAVYHPDHVLVHGSAAMQPTPGRASFHRAGAGVSCVRLGGRLARHQPAAASNRSAGKPPFDVLRPWLIATRNSSPMSPHRRAPTPSPLARAGVPRDGPLVVLRPLGRPRPRGSHRPSRDPAERRRAGCGLDLCFPWRQSATKSTNPVNHRGLRSATDPTH